MNGWLAVDKAWAVGIAAIDKLFVSVVQGLLLLGLALDACEWGHWSLCGARTPVAWSGSICGVGRLSTIN